MNLKDFHCDSLELRLKFASGEMDVDAFVKAVTERGTKIDIDEDGDRDIAFSFGSLETRVDYHAHMRVSMKKDGSGRTELSFHSGPLGDKQEQPPYVEDCANWLGAFFKGETLLAHIHSNYTFGKSFTPVVTLPFPLMTSEKVLAGALVTGLALLLPEDGESKTAIIQSTGDETYIFLRMESQINLKAFRLFSELETLAAVVNPLLKKQEADNESSGTPKAK